MTSSPQETTAVISNEIARMNDLLLGIVQSLVDRPEKLRLESEIAESGTTFRLYVVPEDVGKVIGKQGRTARSLRTLLGAIGSKTNQRFALDVVEDE